MLAFPKVYALAIEKEAMVVDCFMRDNKRFMKEINFLGPPRRK